MTGEEQKRFEELEDEAVDNYLNDSNFNLIDWLADEDKKEYCELYNKQFTDFNCLCEEHK